jgi:hypothetical protein
MQVCNIFFSGEHTPTSDQTSVPRRTSWYSRLSAEKKAEYIEKQRNSRQKKKSAGQPQQLVNQGTAACQYSNISALLPNMLYAGERSPLGDLTNLSTDGKQNGTSWYARLSAEQKTDYLNKQRIYRQMKKIAPLNLEKLYDEGKQS